MPSDDRFPKLLVVALIALMVASIRLVPAQRANPDHFVVRVDHAGRIFAQGEGVVGTIPVGAEPGWFMRSDNVWTSIKDALVRWLGDRPRDKTALRLQAPAATPWSSIELLTWPAGFPDVRIPTLALRPSGEAGVDVPLYGDKGITDDMSYGVRHVHLQGRRITVFEQTVTNAAGAVWVETEQEPRAVRYRSAALGADDLAELDRVLRTDRDSREGDAWSGPYWAVAFTWDSEDTQTTFAAFTRVVSVILALEPDEFLFQSWTPDA